MKCSYTYNTTSIIQTINGEEEVVTSHQGWIYINDTIFDSECIKDGEFTIETEYELKGDTTTLNDYVYTCVRL